MSALAGKFALVTGASKGIGKGIALELARRGARVAVNYHSDCTGGEDTAAAIGGLAVQADVGSRPAVDAMFDRVLAEFGRLDILVNNAGTQVFKPLIEMTEEEWDRVIDTNLKGCFLCTQRAARAMRPAGGGHIINIGSGSNKAPFPQLAGYTASKGGIEMFTKVAAMEFGPYGITVNCVAPGAIEIERTRHEAGDYAGTWGKLTPLGRVGQPEDVAQAVAFLASDEAQFVTAQTLYVDGGLFTHPQWPYKEG